MSLDLEVENHTCIGALFIALLAWALRAVLLPNLPFSQVGWEEFIVFVITSCEPYAKV